MVGIGLEAEEGTVSEERAGHEGRPAIIICLQNRDEIEAIGG